MGTYEMEIGGRTYEAEADSPEQAAAAAKQLHLQAATNESIDRATAGAQQRSEFPGASQTPDQRTSMALRNVMPPPQNAQEAQDYGTGLKVGLAAIPAAVAAPSVLPFVGRAMSSPIGGAVQGAYVGYKHGGVQGAIEGGIIGYAGGTAFNRLGRIVSALGNTAKTAAAAAPEVEAAVPALAQATEAAAPMAVKVAKKAADVAIERAQTAPNMQRAIAYAKQVAAKNPKIGEKIWMELDPGGTPFRVLTPDQAGAAARAGRPTTWVKNLWGKSID